MLAISALFKSDFGESRLLFRPRSPDRLSAPLNAEICFSSMVACGLHRILLVRYMPELTPACFQGIKMYMKKWAFKMPTMESVVRFLDVLDDFIISIWIRLRRSLSRKPRERRRIPRPPEMAAKKAPDSGGKR